MPNPPLASHYTAYIAAINTHSSLSPFVHEQVTHNGRRMTVSEYEAMIEASFDAAPDLYFNVKMLLATEDSVAARIWFDCTPEKEFLGCQPTGKGKVVHFAEHVFYRFRDGKIEEVWSICDVQAVAQQLGTSAQ